MVWVIFSERLEQEQVAGFYAAIKYLLAVWETAIPRLE